MYVWVDTYGLCHMHDIRGQFMRFSSLPVPCKTQTWNSSMAGTGQATLLAGSSSLADGVSSLQSLMMLKLLLPFLWTTWIFYNTRKQIYVILSYAGILEYYRNKWKEVLWNLKYPEFMNSGKWRLRIWAFRWLSHYGRAFMNDSTSLT